MADRVAASGERRAASGNRCALLLLILAHVVLAADGSGVKPVAAQRRRKGPKPRHVPRRTCVVLRQTDDKRALVRLVRTPEGRVEVDPTGKRNGRGAYLTADRAVWERALDGKGGGVLARALKAEIAPDDLLALRAHAETLPSDPALAAQLQSHRAPRASAAAADAPDESQSSPA